MATRKSKPGTQLPLSSVPNFRDLGGYETADGRRMRPGLLYRSAELGRLTPADRRKFEALEIRTIFDLRTAAERAAEPDPMFTRTENIEIDVLAGSTDAVPAQLLTLLDDPKAAKAALGGKKAQKQFEAAYREIVSLDTAIAGYRKLFVDLSKPRHRPALIHCTTGKDRTGWASAAMLLLMGVPEEAVMEDYLLSGTYLLPAFASVVAQFAAAGGDPELLTPVLGVQASYLEAALDEVRTQYGSIEGYFSKGLRIGPAEQRHMQGMYLEG
jgi:protein-tyrosine phosphatase